MTGFYNALKFFVRVPFAPAREVTVPIVGDERRPARARGQRLDDGHEVEGAIGDVERDDADGFMCLR